MIECDLASLLDTGCSHLFVGPYFTTETVLLWSLMQRVVQNTRVGLYRVLGVLCLQLFYLLRKRQSHDLTLKVDSCGLIPTRTPSFCQVFPHALNTTVKDSMMLTPSFAIVLASLTSSSVSYYAFYLYLGQYCFEPFRAMTMIIL